MRPAFAGGHRVKRRKAVLQPAQGVSSAKPQDSAIKRVHFAPEARLVHSDLFSAVLSLYDDELKPCLCTLKDRLNERLPRDEELADLSVSTLSELCHKSLWLFLQQDHCSKCFVLLRGRQASFVDVLSPVDVYPAELWVQMASFFECPEGAALEMPGGRYDSAKMLMSLSLPFLQGYSLGKVCHIIQLAIIQKNILGYSSLPNVAIIPQRRSAELMKIKCADQSCSVPSTVSAHQPQLLLPVASRAAAYLHDGEILPKDFLSGTRCLPLLSVEPVCRSDYNLNLRERALGHGELAEPLTKSQFQDVCGIRMKGRGHVAVPSQRLPESMGLQLSLSQLDSNMAGSPQHSPCETDGKRFQQNSEMFSSAGLFSGLESFEDPLPERFPDDLPVGGGRGACSGGQTEVPAPLNMRDSDFESLTRLSL
mmetsp:Transcript_41733/g.91000  ORF Transcript_41733/g.91000 Transcript_41733/m.91000 type:complete len:423 (+) Transcript_41733:89-1357(+)